LSYTVTRSIFSLEQRALQTLQTINSIRQKVPAAKIILLEKGLTQDLPYDISDMVDIYSYIGGSEIVRTACDSKFKGFGEAVGLIFAQELLKDEDAFYLKISGRYSLIDSFQLEKWDFNKFNFLKSQLGVSTVLYGVPYELMSIWFQALTQSIPFLLENQCIEHVLPRFIPEKAIHGLECLGVGGRVSPTGEYLEE
jgi:hypothetical protein